MNVPTTSPLVPIFDCDGVLVDSEVLAVEVEGALLRDAGFEVSNAEIRDRYVGLSYPDMAAAIEVDYQRDVSGDLLDEIRRQTVDAIDDRLQPIEGISNLLERHRGHRCVASSSRLDRIIVSLQRCQLDHFFDADLLFSTEFVQRGKPSPDVYLKAAESLGVAPTECIVIEDSPTGATAGVAAGMTVLGFTAGGHAGRTLADRLLAVGVDQVCASTTELAHALSQRGVVLT